MDIGNLDFYSDLLNALINSFYFNHTSTVSIIHFVDYLLRVSKNNDFGNVELPS